MDYELDLTPEDIGDIVTIIRVQHLKLHVLPFAQAIGVKEKVVLAVEDGSGPLGMLVLKKINETFPSVDITFNVKTK